MMAASLALDEIPSAEDSPVEESEVEEATMVAVTVTRESIEVADVEAVGGTEPAIAGNVVEVRVGSTIDLVDLIENVGKGDGTSIADGDSVENDGSGSSEITSTVSINGTSMNCGSHRRIKCCGTRLTRHVAGRSKTAL